MKGISKHSALVSVIFVVFLMFGLATLNPAHAENVIKVGTIEPVSGWVLPCSAWQSGRLPGPRPAG